MKRVNDTWTPQNNKISNVDCFLMTRHDFYLRPAQRKDSFLR